MNKNDEKSGKRTLRWICLFCGAENDAGEVICRNCGKPLRTSNISKRRDILEKIAAFAILIIGVFVVWLVLRFLHLL